MRSLRHLMGLTVFVAVTTAIPAAPAVTVLECMDASGHSTFQDRCPPGTTKKGEKKVGTEPKAAGPDIGEITAKNPIVLYTAPECDACDLVRMQLQNRGVPFAEKDVSKDFEKQNELKALTGGTLTVPVVHVASDVLTGYNKQSLDNALDKAGYPPKAAAKPAAGKEAPVAAGSATPGAGAPDKTAPATDAPPAGGESADSEAAPPRNTTQPWKDYKPRGPAPAEGEPTTEPKDAAPAE